MNPNRVVFSPRYAALKRALPNGETRLGLDLAEEAIIVDPIRRAKRVYRPDGTIADFAGPDIVVIFTIDDDTLVFLDFLDLTASP